MEAFADVAPAHNPPYTKAMRMLAERFPKLPLVAAFETGFHRTIPEANQRLRHSRAVVDRIRRPPLGIPWRQPPLHRRADGPASRSLRPETDLVPPRGAPPSVRSATVSRSLAAWGWLRSRACPRTIASAISTSSPCRSCSAKPARASRKSSTSWRTNRAFEGLSGAGRDLRDIEAAAKAGRRAGRVVAGGLYRRGPPVPRGLPRRTGRGRRDRLHRRHRRELGHDPVGRLPRPGLARCLVRPGRERGGVPERKVSAAGSKIEIWTVPTNEEIVVARRARELLASSS